MSKLWKRRRRQVDIEDHADTLPTTLNPNIFSRTSQTVNKHRYRHYAANIRYSEDSHIQKNPEVSATASTNVVMAVLATSVLMCFVTMPDTTLRIVLLGELLFCGFPPFFANWVVLLAILLPMKVQSRTEVVLGLAMLSWISKLEWTYAWERIRHRIDLDYINSRDDSGPKA